VEVVDALLKLRVARKIVQHLKIKCLFLVLEGFKEFGGAPDMAKVALEGMQGGMVGLALPALGIFGRA
jgi:hypothetical protein